MPKESERDPESGIKGASDLKKSDKSNDPIGMPNVSPAIKKETERLTKEFLNDMKSLIIMNVNYESIDFIPEEEIDIDNQADFVSNEWNNIVNQITDKIKMGDSSASAYPNFLDMFEVVYNINSGIPEIKFNLEFSGFGAEDLSLDFADTRSSQINVGSA